MKNKLGGSHSSIIEPAKWFIKEAEKLPGLVKYAPGIIKSAGSSEERIKIIPESGCVRVVYYSKRYLQEIRFYGDVSYLENELNDIWNLK